MMDVNDIDLASIAPAPAGWQLCVDPVSSQFVYYNPETHETVAAQQIPKVVVPITPTPRKSPDFESLPLPPGWEEGKDKHGRSYFINHNEQTTTWEDPRKKLIEETPPLPPITPPTSFPVAAVPEVPEQLHPEFSAEKSTGVKVDLEDRPTMGRAASAYARLSLSPPQWNTSEVSLVLSCNKCQTEFSFFKRRNACGCCFRQFCATCCEKEIDVPVFDDSQISKGKVCDGCFRHLSAGHGECIGRLFPALDISGPKQLEIAREIVDVISRDSSNIYASELTLPSVHKAVAALLSGPDTRFLAVQIIAHIARDPSNYESIGEHCCAALVSLLGSVRSIEQATEVTLVLQSIIRSPSNQSRFCLVGGVEHLVSCISRFRLHQQGGESDVPDHASNHPPVVISTSMTILHSLAENGATLTVLQSSTRLLPTVLDLLATWSGSLHPTSVLFLENALAILDAFVGDDHVKVIINQHPGAVKALVNILATQKGQLQVLALAILTRMSAHDDCCRSLIEASGVKAMIHFLEAVSGVVHKQNAANILLKLASMTPLKAKVIQDLVELGNGLPLIVALIGSEDPSLRQLALLILMAISDDHQVRVRLRDIGGIHRLVGLLGHTDDSVKEHALVTLGRLSVNNEENSLAILNSGGLMGTVSLLASQNTQVRIEAARAIAYMSASSDKMAAAILAVGGIQSLIHLLSSPLEAMKENASDALANLAKSGICREAIVSCGGIGCVVPLLSSANETVQSQALRILQILAIDTNIRESAVNTGCLPNLVRLLDSPRKNIKTQAALALLNFSADSDTNRQSILELGGVSGIVALYATHDDPSIKLLASEVITIWSGSVQGREGIAAAGVLPLIIDALKGSPSSKQPAVDPAAFMNHAAIALSNLSADDNNHDAIFDLGGLEAMLKLIRSPFVEKQQCACFALGNLARHMRCRNYIIQSGGVGAIIRLLMSSNEMIHQQAAFTLAFLSKDPKVAEQIASPGSLDMSFAGENEAAASLTQGMAAPVSPSTPTKPQPSPAPPAASDDAVEEETDIPMLPSSPMAAIVRLLFSKFPDVLSLGVTILMNICGENSSNWKALVQQGGVNALCVLLSSQQKMAQRRAAEELSKLSHESAFVTALLEPHHLPILISMIISPDLDLRVAIIGAIAQISSHAVSWPLLIEQGGLYSLLELLSIDDIVTQTNASVALANLSESEAILARIGQSGVIPRLIDLLYSTNLALQSSIAKITANLVRDPVNARQVVECNGIQVFVDLISSTSTSIQESAALALGRLAHFDECRTAILSASKLPGVLSILLSSSSFAVQSTAVLLVGILCCEPSFAPIISSTGIITPLVALITIGATPATRSSSVELSLPSESHLSSSSSSSSSSTTTTTTTTTTMLSSSTPSPADENNPTGTPVKERRSVTPQASPNRFDRSPSSTSQPADLPPSFEEAIVANSPQSDPTLWSLREDAARTLLALSSSGIPNNKTAIFQAGGLPALLGLTQHKAAAFSLQEVAIACIAQLMSNHSVKKSFRELGGIQMLRTWCQNPDLHRFLSLLILHLSLDSLASASIGTSGVLQTLIQILTSSNNREVILNLLQAFSSLMMSIGNQEIFRSHGGWATLAQFFTVDDPEVRLLCAALLRTLTANGTSHSDYILSSGIISLIIDLLVLPSNVELVSITLLDSLLNLLHSDIVRPHIVQLLTLSDSLLRLSQQSTSISVQYLTKQVLAYVF